MWLEKLPRATFGLRTIAALSKGQSCPELGQDALEIATFWGRSAILSQGISNPDGQLGLEINLLKTTILR